MWCRSYKRLVGMFLYLSHWKENSTMSFQCLFQRSVKNENVTLPDLKKWVAEYFDRKFSSLMDSTYSLNIDFSGLLTYSDWKTHCTMRLYQNNDEIISKCRWHHFGNDLIFFVKAIKRLNPKYCTTSRNNKIILTSFSWIAVYCLQVTLDYMFIEYLTEYIICTVIL